jgi:hypothetical protein
LAENTSITRIPRVDFTSMNFANVPIVEGLSASFRYSNPQYDVRQAVTAPMSGGQILFVTPPYLNSPWKLDFHGPALQCNPVSSGLQKRITSHIMAVLNSTTCQLSYGYLSWVPGTGENASLPFDYNGSTYELRPNTIGPQSAESSQNPQISLFVAAFPNMRSSAIEQACDSSQLEGSTIIQCDLYNASYVTNFTFADGKQNVQISINGSYGNVDFLDSVAGVEPLGAKYANGSFIFTSDHKLVYNTTLVENFAYEAIMDAFGGVLIGPIASAYSGVATERTSNSSVLSTRLVNTKELAFLSQYLSSSSTSSLQSAKGVWDGFSIVLSQMLNLSMAQTIEEMFVNSTISLMSSALLQ